MCGENGIMLKDHGRDKLDIMKWNICKQRGTKTKCQARLLLGFGWISCKI